MKTYLKPIIALLLVAAFALTSCHPRCTCPTYTGVHKHKVKHTL